MAASAGAGTDGPRDESVLAGVAVALARYEACYRGGIRDDDPLLRLGAAPHVEDLLGLCPRAAADEISRLVAAARRGLAPLFPASVVETNPDFTSFGMPADGDLVIDGVLLDVKTVGRSRLRVEWLWQLLGYVFLDHDGRHGITHVGLYLSRHAWLGTWPVDELVTALAGEPSTVEDLRLEFLEVVTRRT